jgi:hypothetical protein
LCHALAIANTIRNTLCFSSAHVPFTVLARSMTIRLCRLASAAIEFTTRVAGRNTGCTRLTGSSSELDMVSKRYWGGKKNGYGLGVWCTFFVRITVRVFLD